MRTEERGEDPSTFSFIFIINLFKSILIGLNYSILLFHVWTEDMFLFSDLPVFVITERHLKVASYQHVYEVISLLIRLSMLDNRRDYNLLTTCMTV